MFVSAIDAPTTPPVTSTQQHHHMDLVQPPDLDVSTPTAAFATANTTDPTPPGLAQPLRPLAPTQLRVVADADETDNSDPHYNAESMANAPTTPAAPSTQPDKQAGIAYPPDLDVSTPTADFAATNTLVPTQQDSNTIDAYTPTDGFHTFPRNASLTEHFPHEAPPPLLDHPSSTSIARTSDRTITFDIPEDEQAASSSEQAMPVPRPTTLDDIRHVAPSDSVRAGAAHLTIRGVSNSSAAFPNNALFLSQVHPDAIVDPARYFHQIGESIPAMRAANVHIQECIQQVRLNPPTMDQDVRLVPGT